MVNDYFGLVEYPEDMVEVAKECFKWNGCLELNGEIVHVYV